MRDDALIQARKEVAAAEATMIAAKETAKIATKAHESLRQRFEKMFDEANDLHLFVDVETGELHS